MRLGKRKGAAWLVNTHVGPAHLYTAVSDSKMADW